jgi:hypothetical protein
LVCVIPMRVQLTLKPPSTLNTVMTVTSQYVVDLTLQYIVVMRGSFCDVRAQP